MTQPTDEFKKPDPSQAQDDRPTPFDSPSLRLVPRLEGVVVTLCRVQHRDTDYGLHSQRFVWQSPRGLNHKKPVTSMGETTPKVTLFLIPPV